MTVGNRTLTATDTVTSSITGSATTTVTAAAAATFTVTGFPSTTVAGTAQIFTVTAKDAFGNTATGYTGTVSFTSTDGQAILPANYVFSAADAGTHNFIATMRTVGNRTLTATDTVTSSITGSASTTVTAAAATIFALTGFPSTTTAGAAQAFTLTAKDAFGNTATGYTGTVSITSTDGQALLPAKLRRCGVLHCLEDRWLVDPHGDRHRDGFDHEPRTTVAAPPPQRYFILAYRIAAWHSFLP